MLAFSYMDGKLDFSIESLNFETRTLANISAFPLAITRGLVPLIASNFNSLKLDAIKGTQSTQDFVSFYF